MVRLSKSEFLANVTAIVERPIPEPIKVAGEGSDDLVVMSAAEYERITHGERRVMTLADLTKDDLARIAEARVPEEFDHLDEELQDDDR